MNSTEKFWDTTYKKNIGKLIGTCYRYVQDFQLAEDLAHDAFITAINKANTFKGKGEFEAWLRRVVVNTALMHLRKKHAELYTDDLTMHENMAMEKLNDDHEPTLIENADFSKEELLNAAKLLPEHHKLVFNLYVIDGYTHQQIGDELGISSGTSKSHLARARKKLQQILNEQAQEKQHKKNWKRALIILIWPGKAKAIDTIYKEKFASYEIMPETFFQMPNLNFEKIVSPIIKQSVFTTKNTIISFAVIATAGLIYLSSLKGNKEISQSETIFIDTSCVLKNESSRIDIKDTLTTIKPQKASISKPVENQPVVVVKKKIKKTPIVVKKKLIIENETPIDTSYLMRNWRLLNDKNNDTLQFSIYIPEINYTSWFFEKNNKLKEYNVSDILKVTNQSVLTTIQSKSYNIAKRATNKYHITIDDEYKTATYRIIALDSVKLSLLKLNEIIKTVPYYPISKLKDSALFKSDTLIFSSSRQEVNYGRLLVKNDYTFSILYNYKTISSSGNNGNKSEKTIAKTMKGKWVSSKENENITFILNNGEKYSYTIMEVDNNKYFIKQ